MSEAPGFGARADGEAPELGIAARRRIGARRLIRRGLGVELSSGEPVRLAVALRSTGFGRRRHSPGTIKRPRSIKLAALELGEAQLERGLRSVRVKLELGEKARRKLRRRASRRSKPLPARVIAVAVDGAGNRSAEVLEIEIGTR